MIEVKFEPWDICNYIMKLPSILLCSQYSEGLSKRFSFLRCCFCMQQKASFFPQHSILSPFQRPSWCTKPYPRISRSILSIWSCKSIPHEKSFDGYFWFCKFKYSKFKRINLVKYIVNQNPSDFLFAI